MLLPELTPSPSPTAHQPRALPCSRAVQSVLPSYRGFRWLQNKNPQTPGHIARPQSPPLSSSLPPTSPISWAHGLILVLEVRDASRAGLGPR